MILIAGCDSVTNPQVDALQKTDTDGVSSTPLLSSAGVQTDIVTVTPDDPSWFFSSGHYDEDGELVASTSGSGGIAAVPNAGIWGSYAFELTIPANQKARAMTHLYNGNTLGEIEEVTYSTYIESAWLAGYGPSINVMIDPEGPDDFVTLVWEANKAGHAILEDTWQSWSSTGGTGGWWSPSIRPFNSSTLGSNANPAQLSALAAHFGEDSEVIGFAINVGRHGAMTSYVDGVGITVNGETTIYDFELYRVASEKDDCKKGGWSDVRRADGSEFRNQGLCVKYVNTGR